MIAIETWTGRHALLLRRAMRCSQREFAAYLGVALRTVTKWEARLDALVLRPETAQILDTALARCSDEIRERFFNLVEEGTTGAPVEDSPVLQSSAESPDVSAIGRDLGADGLVDIYDRLLVNYAALDNVAGPLSAVSMITQHADLLANAAERDPGPLRSVLLRTAARYAEFAGWLHQDAGDLVCGATWTEKALNFAHAGGDAGLVAYVLMRRSNQAVEQGKSTLALGLAEAALNSAGASTARIRALGLRQRAAGLALGQDPQGAIDAFAEARDCIAADPDWNPLTGYCTLPYLDAEAAVCQLLLGRAEAAVDLLAPAINAWPQGYARDRAFYQAHFANALIGSGLVEDGVAHAIESAKAVRSVGSQRTVKQLQAAAGALVQGGHVDASAALLQELAGPSTGLAMVGLP